MEMVGVVYASRATKEMLPEEIDRLLVSARSYNASVGVSGMLLYGRKQFFQYFEGMRQDVDDVYERVRRSSLHSDILELENAPIPHRVFNRWFMGFSEAPESVLQTLSQEQWSRERPWMESHETTSDGLRRLLAFIDESSVQQGT
ncbi:MAG: BLUF domain-containing protein [Pseudomonadota bacterium]|nr:BLUF domain-containing protein [Pseudomonadota bacterium]